MVVYNKNSAGISKTLPFHVLMNDKSAHITDQVMALLTDQLRSHTAQ